ncbi:LysE family translocator [Actinomadura rayongensis]|uniref:LysE family transporter n=1 Tax=Actinomadura rayongensis TaxID=1429076 RepID=A0A6I4W632_9ACTN|nr:LysE family translocator [Actinomadura rayongensis]MXQ64988.1 LysE family transporter [Actinomadura rayongensis]
MVTMTAVLGVMAVGLGLVLTPGPNMVYLVSRSVAQGRTAGLVSLGGVAAGFAVYVVAVAAGLGTVFTLVPAVHTAVKLAGAAYLLWLAWKAVRPGGTSPFDTGAPASDPPRRLFTMGLVTNLLNPKIAVLYVSLLPQFADPARGPVAAQLLVLGLAHVAVAVAVNGLIVLGAGGVAGFLARRPGWRRAQRYVLGTALAGLALALARPAAP